jgi:hypothetical protein
MQNIYILYILFYAVEQTLRIMHKYITFIFTDNNLINSASKLHFFNFALILWD